MLTFSDIAEHLFSSNEDGNDAASAWTSRADRTAFSGDETTVFSDGETTAFSSDERQFSSVADTHTAKDERTDNNGFIMPLPPPPPEMPIAPLLQDDYNLARQDSLHVSYWSAHDESTYTVDTGTASDGTSCSGITYDGSITTVGAVQCLPGVGYFPVTNCMGRPAAGDRSITTAGRTHFGCVPYTEEDTEHMLKEAIAAMLRNYASCNVAEDNSLATKTDRSKASSTNSSATAFVIKSTAALNRQKAWDDSMVEDKHAPPSSSNDCRKLQGSITPASDREDYFLTNPSMESVASSLHAEIEPAVKEIKNDLDPNVSSIRHTTSEVKEQGFIQVINNTLFGSTRAVQEILDLLEEKGFFKSAARLFSCTFMDEDAQKRFTQQVIPSLSEAGLIDTMMHLVSNSLEDAVDAIASHCFFFAEKKAVGERVCRFGPKAVADIIEHDVLDELANASVVEMVIPSQYSPDGSSDTAAPKELHPAIEIVFDPDRRARKGEEDKEEAREVSRRSRGTDLTAYAQKRRNDVARVLQTHYCSRPKLPNLHQREKKNIDTTRNIEQVSMPPLVVALSDEAVPEMLVVQEPPVPAGGYQAMKKAYATKSLLDDKESVATHTVVVGTKRVNAANDNIYISPEESVAMQTDEEAKEADATIDGDIYISSGESVAKETVEETKEIHGTIDDDIYITSEESVAMQTIEDAKEVDGKKWRLPRMKNIIVRQIKEENISQDYSMPSEDDNISQDAGTYFSVEDVGKRVLKEHIRQKRLSNRVRAEATSRAIKAHLTQIRSEREQVCLQQMGAQQMKESPNVTIIITRRQEQAKASSPSDDNEPTVLKAPTSEDIGRKMIAARIKKKRTEDQRKATARSRAIANARAERSQRRQDQDSDRACAGADQRDDDELVPAKKTVRFDPVPIIYHQDMDKDNIEVTMLTFDNGTPATVDKPKKGMTTDTRTYKFKSGLKKTRSRKIKPKE